jgi:phosphoenolpyruvate-protein phosphotransferase
VVWENGAVDVPRTSTNDPVVEEARLAAARDLARAELAALQAGVAESLKGGEADIFFAYQLFIDDVSLLKAVRSTLSQGLNAEAAWMGAIDTFATQMEALPDPTLRARAADIRDVGRRVLDRLLGRLPVALRLDRPSILVAPDLSPSQTASLEKEKVLAFCTASGGPTSHTAIVAKALGLPAVVALGPEILAIEDGSLLLVDGSQGEVVVNPDAEAVAVFGAKTERNLRNQNLAAAAALQPAITRDGISIEVAANIGGLEDALSAVSSGAEGVGLLRTEFLFQNRTSLPPEEEQVQVYREIFACFTDQPIVVRTLDIGGDKAVSYLGVTQETNPFLGWRAVRMIEGRPDILQTQLRALLRAGAGKKLRIMIPMISSLEEVLRVKQLFAEACHDLQSQGLPFTAEVQLGIMVEVPSAALLADRIAPYVDFFSIGTNDLTQYTLAVDRTNPRVARLASPFDPAVLYLIQRTILSAHAHQRWVGMCGEMAGDVMAVPLLVGLGLDELSMAPGLIPTVKQAIRNCRQADCQPIAERAVTLSTRAEVIDFLTERAAALDFA